MATTPDVTKSHRNYTQSNFSALHEPQPLPNMCHWKEQKNIFNRKDDYNICLVLLLNANSQDNLAKCGDTEEPEAKLFWGRRI